MEGRFHTIVNGIIAGYDPGGINNNGLALLKVSDSKPIDIVIKTLPNPEAVINEIQSNDVLGLGVDTLSCWCTGNGGWRPADRWLICNYPEVRNSIMSPNALSGSMGINGMSVLVELESNFDEIVISETHPKILYYALNQQKYDYANNHQSMDILLSNLLGINVTTSNDHEWDAAISAYAVLMGISGAWKNDLHALQLEDGCRIIRPCGETYYYWPDVL